jgi:nucleoside phosphorylase
MQAATQHECDVLLVTVTDTETDALRATLQQRYGRAFENLFVGPKTYRKLGLLGGARTVLVRSEMGAVGLGSSLLTINAGIEALKPAAVIMLGIAFGVDSARQQIGDLLVSRQLMLYDLQRVGTDPSGAYQIRARGDRPAASPWLLDRFRAGSESWNGAPVRFGLILSGEKLVDNHDFRTQLRQLESEAIGGEMEGAGLYVAAQNAKVDWIMVKAISDWGDGTKQHREDTQLLAARNAAEFVFHVLEQGGLARPTSYQDQAAAVSSVHVEPARLSSGSGMQADAAQAPAAPQLSGPQLRALLTERLGVDELRTACYDIGVDWDNLRGEVKPIRVLELIAYLDRRGERAKLYAWLQENRPDIELRA